MKIKYINGDLFKTEHKFILHGCNDIGVMGAGVAKIIKQKYPLAFETYRNIYEHSGLKLGHIYASTSNGKTILNGITQKGIGRGAVDYAAIREVMRKIDNHPDIRVVAMPKIGAGLAGGDWNVISQTIEDEFANTLPVVYVI